MLDKPPTYAKKVRDALPSASTFGDPGDYESSMKKLEGKGIQIFSHRPYHRFGPHVCVYCPAFASLRASLLQRPTPSALEIQAALVLGRHMSQVFTGPDRETHRGNLFQEVLATLGFPMQKFATAGTPDYFW